MARTRYDTRECTGRARGGERVRDGSDVPRLVARSEEIARESYDGRSGVELRRAQPKDCFMHAPARVAVVEADQMRAAGV